MNLNKSPLLINTPSALIPPAATGARRNDGAGQPLGASFSALFKSTREQQLPQPTPVPSPAPHATAPAPAPSSTAVPKPAANSSAKPAPAPAPQQAAGAEAAATGQPEPKAAGTTKPTAARSATKADKADSSSNAADDIDTAESLAAPLADALRLAQDTEAGEAGAEDGGDEPEHRTDSPTPVPGTTLLPSAPATAEIHAAGKSSADAVPRQDLTPDAVERSTAPALNMTDERPSGRGTLTTAQAPGVAGKPDAAATDPLHANAAGGAISLPDSVASSKGHDAMLSATAAPQAAGTEKAAATPLSFQQALTQAQSVASAASPGSAEAPRSVALQQDLYSPGFAPEMSARLSMLASDGVQSAQLHLNPAEMGPVAVQIVLDGQQAQISFHSDQAETRAVLERSLPDLAAALRENGLTLSGGGVFQQDAGTRQQAQADGAATGRGNARSAPADAADVPAAASAAPVRRTASRGVLDTYA